MICNECGEMTNDFVIIDGKAYCKDCVQQCEYCGDWFFTNDLETLLMHDRSVETVCSYCKDNHYYTCYECGRYMTEDDEHWVEDEEICVCPSCLETHFIQCYDCGTYVRRHGSNHFVTVYGDDICRGCREEEYCYCDDCGELYPNDDIYEYRGNYYCRDCYDEHNNPDIYDYHEFDDFFIHKMPSENPRYAFGFEIEVAGSERYTNDVKELLDGDAVLMYDGSVCGFEIVTQPFSTEYFEKVFKKKIDRTLEFLRNHDFKGHNQGGIHIHISGLSKGQIAQMCEILYGNIYDRNMWLCITQRKESEMNKWCSMKTEIDDFETIRETGHIVNDYYVYGSKYTALNEDSRTGTYELRIFNSNIRLERFLKNYECALALCEYTQMYEDYDQPICSTKGFIKYVLHNGLFYPNLYAFMQERDMENRYGIRYTEEELEVA